MPSTDERLMRLALEQARLGLSRGEFPFGAVLIDAAGNCVAATHDTVEADNDYSSHAETMLVKQACRTAGRDLSGCTLYTTVEPCPMCFTTSWLAHVSRLVFGATMAEVAGITAGKTRELAVPAQEMNRLGGNLIALVGGVLREDCLDLFRVAMQSSVRRNGGGT